WHAVMLPLLQAERLAASCDAKSPPAEAVRRSRTGGTGARCLGSMTGVRARCSILTQLPSSSFSPLPHSGGQTRSFCDRTASSASAVGSSVNTASLVVSAKLLRALVDLLPHVPSVSPA